jgi:hypothetical protein
MRRLLAVVFFVGIGAILSAARPADASVTATIFARPNSVSQAQCPYVFTFHATISFTQPGPISYRWIRSDGGQGPIISKNPSTAGHFGDSDTWGMGGPGFTYSGWAQLEILAPAVSYSNRQPIYLSCVGSGSSGQGRTVSATVFARPNNVTGVQCPYVFTFHATISFSQPGPISYRWVRSDGGQGPIITKNPSTAGHFGASETWGMGGPGFTFSGWERLELLSPHHGYSNQQHISISCL